MPIKRQVKNSLAEEVKSEPKESLEVKEFRIDIGSIGMTPLEQSAQALAMLQIFGNHCRTVQFKLNRKHKNWLKFRYYYDLALLIFAILATLSSFATLINYLEKAQIWTFATGAVALITVLRPYLNLDNKVERFQLSSSSYMRAGQDIDGLIERASGYSGKTAFGLFREQALLLTQRVRELDSQHIDFLGGHKPKELK
jgi:hypothetical protein